MPDTKITALTALTAADPANDVLPIVDVSDTTMAASGTTKKISINNVLGASGTATLASATITGDLTVDTNTLKVDSANNRVGIGTATPAAGAALSVLGTTSVSASDYTVSSTWASRFQAAANNQPAGIFLSGLTSSGAVVPGSLHVEPVAASSRSALIATYAADSAVGYFAINRFSPSAGTTSQHFKIDDTGVATWSNVGGVAGTAMTLNSSGLGVGYTPSGSADKLGSAATLGVVATGVTADLNFRNSSLTSIQRIRYTDGTGVLTIGSASTVSYQVELGGNTTTRAVTIDASSNVGIGVTPAAKFDSLVADAAESARFRAASGWLRIHPYLNATDVCRLQSTNNTNTGLQTLTLEGFSLRFNTNSGTAIIIDNLMNTVSNVNSAVPALATNNQMVFNLTSNTNLRISVRGSDGVTRVANITLA